MPEVPPSPAFSQVFQWVSGFINMERGQKVRTLNLDRMRLLAEKAGNPEARVPALHTAGSKGKGSVTTMISAILSEAGLSCGRYLSPHVSDPRERIGLGLGFFPEPVYAAAAAALKEAVTKPAPKAPPTDPADMGWQAGLVPGPLGGAAPQAPRRGTEGPPDPPLLGYGGGLAPPHTPIMGGPGGSQPPGGGSGGRRPPVPLTPASPYQLVSAGSVGGAFGAGFVAASLQDEPTYFELLTLYFFLCAALGGCDVIAVETGIGGRLDCTNIARTAVSVITLIEREHTDILGETIPEIAGEKAGIIKPGAPVALAAQGDAARAVFEAAARRQGAPLYYAPDTVETRDVRVGPGGTAFTLKFRGGGFFEKPLELFVPLPGKAQAENAALAVLACKLYLPGLTEEAVAGGLRKAFLPARFETLRPGGDPAAPAFVVDGAHTESSARLAAETFRGLYGEGGVLLFGCAAGKDAGGMARALLPWFSRVVITAPGTFKASDPEAVYRAFLEERERGPGGAGRAPEITLEADTRGAIDMALALSRERGLPVLAAGSFYLAAAARSVIAL